MGEQRNAAIANMEAMGFPRADIDRAMRAAFFNPDRAVEYLLNGIPEGVNEERAQAQAQGLAPTAAPTQTADNTGAAAPQTGGEEPLNLFDAAAQAGGRGGQHGAAVVPQGQGEGAAPSLDFLRNNPQFQQLRQIVQQQPQMLEPILQQVAAGNPQIAQLIAQHPDQFMQLLAEDVDDDAALPPGAQQISVTEEEREAIERVSRARFRSLSTLY